MSFFFFKPLGAVELSELNVERRRRRSTDDLTPDHEIYKRQAQDDESTAECRYDFVTVRIYSLFYF